jgi:hypothetical protein
MDATGHRMSVDPRTVEPYQLANSTRQRLLAIREHLAELEARRVRLSMSHAGALATGEPEGVRRARLSAEAARHAAVARRRVREVYLHSASVQEYVAGGHEVGANSDPMHADRYRQRAAWHREAAIRDRLPQSACWFLTSCFIWVQLPWARQRARDRRPDESAPVRRAGARDASAI